jgi:Domain of unknown function (DUF4328)
MTAFQGIEAARNKTARRARWANFLVGACVLLAALAIGSGFLQLNLLGRIQAGEAVSESESSMNDLLYGGIGLTQAAAFIASAILWLMWLHSAYGNLFQVGRRTADETPGWAVGYWFIPILNLFRPYRIVKELWLRSADMNMEPEVKELPAPHLISLWWGTWILDNIVGRIVFRQMAKAETVDSLIEGTWLSMVDDLATILSGALAILVVRRILQLQESWPPETADVFA